MLQLSTEDVLAHLRREAARVGCTKRETEVLIAVTSGDTVAITSRALGISMRTTKQHISTLLRKFAAPSKFALFARLLGLQDLGKVA